MYKYSSCASYSIDFNKEEFLAGLNLDFTPEEWIALKYIHGEGDDYSGKERKMNRVGAICHAADVLSARVLFDVKS